MTTDNKFKPGIYSLPAERYHAAEGVSKSMLDILAAKTPAHLQAYLYGIAQQKETEALRIGAITHRALLEPDTYKDGFWVRPEKMSFTTIAGKQWKAEHEDRPIITFEDAEQIDAMVSAVHTHPFAKRLLAGCQPEQSVFVEDATGILRKSRLDALTTGNVIPDIKTTDSASVESFEKNVSRYRYHVQAAYYLANCNLAGMEKRVFFFIVVEKEPPYLVHCLQLNGDVVDYGKMLFEHDLQLYRNCLETGRWPGWSLEYDEVSLPVWEMRQLEQAVSR